jgi:hypothetical protein
MVSLIDLVNAMAETLGNIPEVLAALAPADPIQAYIDMNPTSNAVDKAIYQMQPGQLLVVWIETRLERAEMSKWVHTVEICLRSMRDNSDLDLINLIMAGVPVPGDGMVWRNCPVMPGLLPTEISAISRRTDTEGVDYGVILTDTAETGDWPYP